LSLLLLYFFLLLPSLFLFLLYPGLQVIDGIVEELLFLWTRVSSLVLFSSGVLCLLYGVVTVFSCYFPVLGIPPGTT